MSSPKARRQLIAASIICLTAGTALAQPYEYTIRRLGIIDSDHAQISAATILEPNGWAAGYTRRAASSATSAWASRDDQTYRLGLLDAAHTKSDGMQDSTVVAFDHRGIGLGTSRRYAPVLGQSAWLWDRDAGTRRIGLIDGAHVSSTGALNTVPLARIARSGFVAGHSNRYIGSSSVGYSAWIADVETATTTRIGFFDAAHTSTIGYQFAQPVVIADNGDVFGFSARFNGALLTGQTAWIDPIGSGPINIGLIDAEHTRTGDYKSSEVRSANPQGLAIGSSFRYSGMSTKGTTAWLYDGNSTVRLGFTDADHTHADGRRSSDARTLTSSGYVTGASTRYLSTTIQTGQSAWLYDPTDHSTTRLGFFDAAHTRFDGLQRSAALKTLDGGIVGGSSRRYDGMASRGNTIWLQADGDSRAVSPDDSLHTRSNGTREATLSAITSFGRAAGTAARYDGNVLVGHSAWIFDPASETTSLVGLFDAVHTVGAMHESSLITFNDAFAIGTTERQTGFAGSTLWFHDVAAKSTTPLIFDMATDGRYATSVFATTDAGEVVGAYANYDGDTFTRNHLFIWDATQGFRDLEGVTENFNPNWELLTSVGVTANGAGLISGNGEYSSGGLYEAYLLTAITLPSSSTLALFGTLALGARRRRT